MATVDQILEMLIHQTEFLALGQPILAGWSRKSTLAKMVAMRGEEPMPSDRLGASLSAALLAVQNGAAIVRVHDVKETVQALKILNAVQGKMSA